MSIGTFFTLVVMPSIYILIAKDHTKDRALEAAADPASKRAPVATSPHFSVAIPTSISAASSGS